MRGGDWRTTLTAVESATRARGRCASSGVVAPRGCVPRRPLSPRSSPSSSPTAWDQCAATARAAHRAARGATDDVRDGRARPAAGRQRPGRRTGRARHRQVRRADLVEPGRADRDLTGGRHGAPARSATAGGTDQCDARPRRQWPGGGGVRPGLRDACGCRRRRAGQLRGRAAAVRPAGRRRDRRVGRPDGAPVARPGRLAAFGLVPGRPPTAGSTSRGPWAPRWRAPTGRSIGPSRAPGSIRAPPVPGPGSPNPGCGSRSPGSNTATCRPAISAAPSSTAPTTYRTSTRPTRTTGIPGSRSPTCWTAPPTRCAASRRSPPVPRRSTRPAVRSKLQFAKLHDRRDRLAAMLMVDPRADQAAWQQHGALLAAVDRFRVEVEAAVRPPNRSWRPTPVTDRQRQAVRRMFDARAARQEARQEAREVAQEEAAEEAHEDDGPLTKTHSECVLGAGTACRGPKRTRSAFWARPAAGAPRPCPRWTKPTTSGLWTPDGVSWTKTH